ncbi:relaxin-3 receptor 1 [Denticeps clupeoides]|uniref:G-protein coupled receptors family 1 profile domain-containing protein n=1 Tax=Denticeps clupeoides TaxID=299321 RepID=A0AAY4EPK3_9TELE|nr:relaxin-3 receptor 1-like [Denticeps clupeoides]
MQRNNSSAAAAAGLGTCGLALEGKAGLAGGDDEPLHNLSLRCWLHLLSQESTPDFYGDSSSLAVRVIIAMVYLLVCALGLVGNLLALYLLHSRHRLKHSSINYFVMGLAVTDLQFVLTLPFWAVDTALDFRWPFGKVMCKIVSSVTIMNMYASVFFLTAMSVARYCSLSSSLKMHSPKTAVAEVRWASAGIWGVSLLATLPHAVYSTTAQVSDDELCLVRFPESGRWDPQLLLGLYQTQKVLLGFVFPLVVISVCYLMLLRFLLRRRVSGLPGGSESERGRHRRRSKVTRSVTIVVLSFFLCWLPNQALTLWGVLIKFDMVPFSKAFYNAQAYAFPLTVCLAHTNSCLNPVLYCLIRQEYRAGLKQALLRLTPSLRRLASQAFRRGKKVSEAPPPKMGLARADSPVMAVVKVNSSV